MDENAAEKTRGEKESVETSPVEKQIEATEAKTVSPSENEASPETAASPIEADSANTLSIEPEQEKPSLFNKRLLIILIGVLVAIGLISLIVYYLKTPRQKEEKEELTPVADEINISTSSAEIESELEPADTATKTAEKEAAKLNLADYTIQILNGSGIVGEAKNVGDKLEAEGFENLQTGNADNYDYLETEVSFKEKTPASLFKTIKEALANEYNVVQKEDLSENSQYDVQIIVGKRTE